MKVQRNAPCPCGSRKKFKQCCGSTTLVSGRPPAGPGLVDSRTLRERNRDFLRTLHEVFEVGEVTSPATCLDLKTRITPEMVARIHAAVADAWPNESVVGSCIAADRQQCRGLYTGQHDVESIVRMLSRQSLYSDTILLVDPFFNPRSVEPARDATRFPERFPSLTVECSLLWLLLEPWIHAGVVAFIHLPDEFDPAVVALSLAKVNVDELDPRVRAAGERDIQDLKRAPNLRLNQDFAYLARSDQEIAASLAQTRPGITFDEIHVHLREVEERRRVHPYFVDPTRWQQLCGRSDGHHGEFRQLHGGTSFERSKTLALDSNLFLVTDSEFRWTELSIDRERSGITLGPWQSFAEAWTRARFSYLENVSLESALEMRQDGMLEEMRLFLRKVWKDAISGNPNGPTAPEDLVAELNERVDQARVQVEAARDKVSPGLCGALLSTASGGAALLTASSAMVPVGLVAFAGLLSSGAYIAKAKQEENRLLGSPAGFFFRHGQREGTQ